MKFNTLKLNWRDYNFGSISLCMIMRDNAKTLRRCLDSVKGLVNEIIIVDTGSKDNSVDVARSYGVKVFFDPWQDDFSRPRNIGISHAKSNWILVLDPDEMLLQQHHTAIKWLTRSKSVVAFWMTTLNYSPPTGEPQYRFLRNRRDPSGRFPGYTPSTKTRFFKNGLGIKFLGCWHELLDWDILNRKLPIVKTAIPVQHWNHEITQKSVKAKGLYYLSLGEKKIKEWPTHGQAWWELAVAEMIQGLRVRASHSIAQAFRYGFGTQQQFFSLARCRHLLGDKKGSKFAFEKGICSLYPSLTHIDPKAKPLGALISKF